MFSQKQSHEHGRILVLDDEKNIVTVLKAILEKRDFEVEGFTDPREALDSLRKNAYDAAITDLYMPEIDGMAFLAEVSRLYPNVPVVMITAFGTVDSAVDAIKKGAFDYVTKPFEQSEIVNVVQKAVNVSRLKRLEIDGGAASAIPAIEAPLSFLLSGKNPNIQEVQRIVHKVAKSPSIVLLSGEPGTGKEYLAEEIHRLSDRSYQPLLKLNCIAQSTLSLENEIFGSQSKPGKLEMANKGTFFIDEISELPVDLQLRDISKFSPRIVWSNRTKM